MFQMKSMLCIALLCTVLCGCNSALKRGMDGNTYISTGHPAIAISVADLPLRTAGSILPALTTGDSLGGIPINAWIAVYGGTTPSQPMAIVSQAELPSDYYWDADLTRSFSVDSGMAVFNGQAYQACTYIVEGSADAFAPLVQTDAPAELRWIVRRFAVRDNFNLDKITLEYREALPSNITSLNNLPHGGVTFLREFAERAEKIFSVTTLTNVDIPVHIGYPQGIQVRYLNTNFFGTATRYSVIE